MAFGTLSVTDLLQSQQTVVAFGEDRIFDAIQTTLDAHNAIWREMASSLASISTDVRRRYGGVDTMEMVELDEIGRPDAQKVTAGANVDFPLRLYGISVQWTRKYIQRATVQEFAEQFIAAQDSDVRMLLREIKRSIFGSANRTMIDRLVQPNITLAVKALHNADSAPVIPNPVDGTTFDGATHTHYLATASFIAANLTSLIGTVQEHYASGDAQVNINIAQEAAVRAFTGFTAYLDARLVGADNVTRAVNRTLDMRNSYNRAIGVFGAAEVWVKPWVPANYVFCYIRGVPVPLSMRERSAGSSNLVIAAEDEDHPLRAQTLEREYGFGVWNRANGAVLYTGGGSYVNPTITA